MCDYTEFFEAVPTLSELGYSDAEAFPKEDVTPLRGGETEALRRLDECLSRTKWVKEFEKPKGDPSALAPPATTVLSPYLKFGCLSSRLMYARIQEVLAKQPGHTKPPVSLIGQLLWRGFFYTAAYGTPHFDRMQGSSICRNAHCPTLPPIPVPIPPLTPSSPHQLLWREFFYTAAYGTPHFDRMQDSSICRQIPWKVDSELLAAWRDAKTGQVPWKADLELLAAWRDARTGFPWIDAIMVQLRQWGWMHHLARHCVACFLTRGDLLVHWELGRDVFDRLLLDADWAINNGNWLWLSASAFFSQFHRIYSPVTFGKKYDPSGKFIRHFLPVLKDMPSQYIYEPWTAPLAVQRRANCIIGKDYPNPIVDHAEASKRCRDVMGAAYAANRSAANASTSGNQPVTTAIDHAISRDRGASRGPTLPRRGGSGGDVMDRGGGKSRRTRRGGSVQKGDSGEMERGDGKPGPTKKKQKRIDDMLKG
ncbi:unnamed protein product [Closterium sp. Yama58-4]|nr:unnamed protein product [Closterium sp. Yama58-4]